MQIYCVVFALSRQINKQKYAKTINFLCAGNKVFVNIKLKGGGLTPTPLAYALGWITNFTFCPSSASNGMMVRFALLVLKTNILLHVENNSMRLCICLTRPVTSLGHQRAKSFWWVSKIFKLCPTHFPGWGRRQSIGQLDTHQAQARI